MLRVIIDTDISSDIDDLGDLAMCLALHKMGQINIEAITVCTSNPKSPGAVDATCKAFGLSFPIGTWKGAPFDPNGPGVYVAYLYDNYPHDVGLASTVEDATTVFARALESSPEPVAVLALGPCNNLQQFRISHSKLIAQKVSRLFLVAGAFPATGYVEWNFQQHPTSGADIAANWPSPITYIGYQLGDTIVTGATLATAMPASDIVRVGYAQAGYAAGRNAWGQMGAIEMVQRSMRRFRGTASVSTSTGENFWTPSESAKDEYVIKDESDATYQARIDALLTSPRAGSLTAWPAGTTALTRLS